MLAYNALTRFREYAVSIHHERYRFPYFSGSYFAYRKVDIMRILAISKSISSTPTYLDVGCGYGDFLNKIRQFIPSAKGIEKDGNIFYLFQREKPDYIQIGDIEDLEGQFDVIFIGWMDPGTDFRKRVANKTKVVITTLDEGISMAAEYEDQGFERIAEWRTPSWEDVNIEIMNKYYSKDPVDTYELLFNLRGAHSLWYVYSKDKQESKKITTALRSCLVQESLSDVLPYDFEAVLDDCGFGYFEQLTSNNRGAELNRLWEVIFL